MASSKFNNLFCRVQSTAFVVVMVTQDDQTEICNLQTINTLDFVSVIGLNAE